MGEIDREEAAYILSAPEERVEQIERDCVVGIETIAPAALSLHSPIANLAINEFIVMVSDCRPTQTHTTFDFNGDRKAEKSHWLSPTLNLHQDPACIQCTMAGVVDKAGIERYI